MNYAVCFFIVCVLFFPALAELVKRVICGAFYKQKPVVYSQQPIRIKRG
jgi:hypothetical protein